MLRTLVVIGGSAGGLEALRSTLASLPADFPAAILVVLHMAPEARSYLAPILTRSSKLPVRVAVHGERIEPGTVLVASPDQHLLVYGERARLTRGPRENRHRPAVDPLFRTAARWYGSRVVGVVLSGVLDDGTSGLMAIKLAGGRTMAQDPDDALYASMPESAIRNVGVDHVAAAAELGAALDAAVREEIPEVPMRRPPDPRDPEESGPAEDAEMDALASALDGPASSFTCPDCHGALWQLEEGEILRFRCRTGHAFSPEALFAGQSDSVEEALWTAYRTLEEAANIAHRLAERAQEQNQTAAVARYRQRAEEAVGRAKVIRKLLENGQRAPGNSDAIA